MISHRFSKVLGGAGRALTLLVLCAIAIVPIAWIILTAFKTRLQIFTPTPLLFFTPTLDAFRKLLSDQTVLRSLSNSLVIAILSALITLILSSLAAYAFSRFRFKGRSAFMIGILATRLMPPITVVIPLFLIFNAWGMIDTPGGLALIYGSLNIPLATWMLKAFFDAIPRELEEAAQIDGASGIGALLRITLPLAAPGFAATLVFIFTLAWNEFMFAFVFTSTKAGTLPILLAQTIGELQIHWSDMAALATVVMIPPLIFSFYMQRHLVAGLQTGAIK